MSGVHQATLSLSLSTGQGKENKMKNNLMDLDKATLTKQTLCVEAKENKIFILYFPWADNDQPLPGKQNFSMHSVFFGRQG